MFVADAIIRPDNDKDMTDPLRTRSNELKNMFLAAVELPADQRLEYLNAAAAGKADLIAGVQKLLERHDTSDGLLDKTLLELLDNLPDLNADHPQGRQ